MEWGIKRNHISTGISLEEDKDELFILWCDSR